MADALGPSLLGMFMTAAGDLWSGAAQGKMYEYQAGLAQQRSQVAEQNAIFAVNAGESQALTSGIRTGQIVGAQKAGQGASNLDVGSGSGARARASQEWAGQVSASNIRTDAARLYLGQKIASTTAAEEATMYSSASATARTASYIGAATDVASKWAQASQAGAVPAIPGLG